VCSNKISCQLSLECHRVLSTIPGHGEDVALNVELVRVAHDPVGEVLDELVAELHLLPERQVVAPHHHRLHQLTHLRLYLYCVDRRVQVTDVPDISTVDLYTHCTIIPVNLC